ncbi:MAG: hypothetical protein KAS46_03460 [Candidatus Aureabacteria bacterium]|nr:hypothetical protein [Candidatus Auribacterota bacterium]
MDKILDASLFIPSSEIYEIEFQSILSGITACYKMMIKDNVRVLPNDENKIRDDLYSKYLNDDAVRKKINFYYNIVCEPAEYINHARSGFVDLKILSQNSLKNTDAYYIIECKRLDNNNMSGTSGLNGDYIKDGIMRFVSSKYLTPKGINGMIGFIVEQMHIPDNIKNINKLLKNNFKKANTKKILKPVNFIKKFKYSYCSTHKVVKGKEIKLYHLMFDFSKNLEKSN